MNFKNRITGQGVEKAGQLLAHPSNFRIHPELQQKGVKGSLDEIGWIQQVIVNKRTGRIIDGHLRVKLALREGEETEVPVIYVDLSENEEKLALSLLDPLTEMAGMDKDIYKELLDELNTTSADLQEVLEDIASKNNILSDGLSGDSFSPELAPKFSTAKILAEDIVKEKARLDDRFKENSEYLEVICPHCSEEFFINKKDVK